MSRQLSSVYSATVIPVLLNLTTYFFLCHEKGSNILYIILSCEPYEV